MDNISELLKAKIKELETEDSFTNKIEKKKKQFEKHGIDVPLAQIVDGLIIEDYPEIVDKILQESERVLKIKK